MSGYHTNNYTEVSDSWTRSCVSRTLHLSCFPTSHDPPPVALQESALISTVIFVLQVPSDTYHQSFTSQEIHDIDGSTADPEEKERRNKEHNAGMSHAIEVSQISWK
ncbi:hypothetical protein V3C99_014155 [Haemonchus contortus]